MSTGFNQRIRGEKTADFESSLASVEIAGPGDLTPSCAASSGGVDGK